MRGKTPLADEATPPDPPPLTEAQLLIKEAIERANAIQDLLMRADIQPDRVTLVALAIVSATAAQQFGLSPNDAFSLFISVYEGSSDQDQARMNRLVEAMKNSISQVVERAVVKKPTTH
jgi:hypothetical protein